MFTSLSILFSLRRVAAAVLACCCLLVTAPSLTFDEALELIQTYRAGVHLYLERHEHGEEELVHLIEAAHGILERGKRQEIDDVLDALAVDGGLLRARHGDVKDAKELLEGRLVHVVDVTHLHDQEVEHTSPSGHCKHIAVIHFCAKLIKNKPGYIISDVDT